MNKKKLSYIWQQNELFQQVCAVFRNKLFKVFFFFFCFHDDGDLRLKREEISFDSQNRCGLWLNFLTLREALGHLDNSLDR